MRSSQSDGAKSPPSAVCAGSRADALFGTMPAMGHVVRTFLLVLAAAHWVSGPARAEAPDNLLFVGNSFSYYNNGLQNHYRRLLNAASPDGRAPGRAV